MQLEEENAATWCAVGKGQQEHIPSDLSELEGWWLNKLGIGLTLWKVFADTRMVFLVAGTTS